MRQTWTQIWNNPKVTAPAALFIGSDPQAVAESLGLLCDQLYPGSKIVQLASKDVIKNPEILTNHSTAQDLFEPAPPQVMVIEQATDKFLEIWQQSSPLAVCWIWSTKLTKKSALRTYFETTPGVALVPTYLPDQAGFRGFVGFLSKKQGLQINASAQELIGAQLNWESIMLPAFLKKISLYKQGHTNNEVTPKDVWACGADTTVGSEDFLFSLIKREKAPFIEAVGALESAGSDIFGSLALLKYYIWRLLRLKELLAQGLSLNQAAYKIVPILPPHVNGALAIAAQKWQVSELRTLLKKLLFLDKALKRRTVPPVKLSHVLLEAVCGEEGR